MDKRTLIINSAIELFSKNGFQATSTTSITKHASVGTGTLFMYFKSKDEMINEIYLEVKKEIAVQIFSTLNENSTLKSNFKNVWTTMINWALQNEYRYKFVNQFSNSPFINTITKEEAIGDFRFVIELIQTAINNEIFISTDEKLIYSLMMGQLGGTISYILENKCNVDVTIDKSFSMLWKSLGS